MTTQLIYGDCLAIMPTLAAQSVDMVLCDLPFCATKNEWDLPIDLSALWAQYRRLVKPNGAIVLFASQPFTTDLITSNRKGYRHKWVWDKGQAGNFAVAKYMPLMVDEDILIFTATGERVNYRPVMRQGKARMRGSKNSEKHGRGFGGMAQVYYESDTYYPTSILQFPGVPRQKRLHPCEKPVDLLCYLLETYSVEEGTVLDNCMGSGSTGVACIQERRKFIGIEMDAGYFEVAQARCFAPEQEVA